ncbi:RNB domain-containing ribonuclease [Sphingobium nicotianae]|uniref:RNB domain-containing ribonuclease n=1 Tax=Sphingobium nicotianae TaxID=2782607 RepID=A0A9X1DAH0_9SPHN|nr:RNB domain-containing ribonuclease [Sphingobium nicotianae]MBT2186430.1 RNB domain-containing ribonuclease [Sphingobium nicotianae]
MKALADPGSVLSDGLARIRVEMQLPASFPPEVIAAAEAAAKRAPSEHVDRTDQPFVTLDPASSTDLDQAFAIEASGNDLLLHYAIADVGWFVRDGDLIDMEAWARGTSQYLPDGKISLYPAILSEQAASLLPDGLRPAVIFTVRLDPQGSAQLDGAERAIIKSRAKLAYETAREADLPPLLPEFARRACIAEDKRGAARVDVPQQEVVRGADGYFHLRFRPRAIAEDRNAMLSLSTNIAIGQVLLAHHTGLFRTMDAPDERVVKRLRNTARAYGLSWPAQASLAQFQRTLDPNKPREAAFGAAVHRAGNGARYDSYQAGVIPWHVAVAATYAHATAPLRRLADRYVVDATLAIANGRPVPDETAAAFARLSKIMARADALGGRIDRAAIDLAEVALLQGREGETFPAIITDIDERGARIQLRAMPVVSRIDAPGKMPGDAVTVRLDATDLAHRTSQFSVVHQDH